MYAQLLNPFGDVYPFLRDNHDLAPGKSKQTSQCTGNNQKSVKLQLKLATVLSMLERHLSRPPTDWREIVH